MNDERATPADLEFRVLHTIRVRGLVSTEDVGAELELAIGPTLEQLESLQQRTLIVHRSGRANGWTLTAVGRDRHTALMADEHLTAAVQPTIEIAYDRFVELNEPFKTLCTDWQTSAEPQRCVPRLHELHPAVEDIANAIGVVDRMSSYGTRFGQALARLDAGDHTAFTTPLANSYHDVWMQLHQDLLLTLGRQRGTADGC